MAKIQIESYLDVDSIYDSLSTSEKREMINLLIENSNFNIDSIYDSFSDSDKEKLSDKLEKDGYFEYDSEPDIECDNKNKLLSLLDKSYMLTKDEIECLLSISNKYKYF